MENKLCLAFCSNFDAEAAAVIASEGFADVEHVVFPAECGHPAREGGALRRFLLAAEKRRIHAIGGRCMANLESAPSPGDACRIHCLDRCSYAIAGKKIVDRYLEEGAYVLIPGWLAAWSRLVDNRESDRDAVRHGFAKPASKVVLLDTGTDPDSHLKLRDFAGLHDLPFETVPVGLDYFRLFLTKTVLEWRLENGRKSHGEVSAVRKGIADYSVILDHTGSLTGAVSEEEAVRNILDLFQILFAPGRLVYVPLQDGRQGTSRSWPPSADMSGRAMEVLADFPDHSDWVDFEEGFVLRFAHQPGQAVGLLAVSDFAFPECKDRHLKLSLTLAGICGLAVSNARSYQLLREEKRKLQEYLRVAGIIFLVIDPDRKVVLINRRGCEILGCEEREVIGRHWFEEFVPDASREEMEAVFSRLMEGSTEGAETVEGAAKTKDGRERTIAWHNTLLRDEQGRVWAALCSGEDITERGMMENALKESEARFRSLSESSPIGIFQVDTGGCCVYTNARWQKVAGLTLQESLGDGWTRALHPEDRDAVLAMWQKCVTEGCESSGKYRFLTPQGEVRWVSAHMAPIRSRTERIGGHVGTVEEITERRRMEEELIKAKKLEATGLLAGGMAHDFNNLLSIILGNISLVQMYRNPRDESLKLLDNVEKACLEAKRLTQQFITFAGGGKPALMNVSARALLGEAVDRALAGSNAGCEIHVGEDLQWLPCDPEQMLQALVNLIVNGREAMGGEGIMKISAAMLPSPPHGVPSLSKGNRAVISITDAGTGIAEEHLARIFDPYFSTRQRGSQKGMGLGLTVAYSIIKAHGGDIAVKSGLGEGTTVDVYLPALPVDGVKDAEAERRPPQAKRKVLLMDEEELFRKVAQRMLERIGYEVESAKDGKEAIERFKGAIEADAPFDVAILDLTILRGVGGRETLRALMKMDRSLKAIVSAARADDPLVSRYSEFGFRGVIFKPFAIKELDKVLKKVIAGAV